MDNGLKFGKNKYYWRVIKNEAAGSVGYPSESPTWSFTTDDSLIISAVAPPSDTVGMDTSDATMKWSSNGLSYVLTYGTSNPPTANSQTFNNTTDTTYHPNNLAFGTKYYWKVVATRLTQKDTIIDNFTTDTVLAVSLKSPANTADKLDTLGLSLIWGSNIRVDSFSLWYDKTTATTNIHLKVQKTPYSIHTIWT